MTKKILIIDDDVDIITAYSAFFSSRGYEVRSSFNSTKGRIEIDCGERFEIKGRKLSEYSNNADYGKLNDQLNGSIFRSRRTVSILSAM